MDTIARVYTLLSERDLSLYTLSKTTPLPYTTIKTAERRGGQLSVETIELFCKALGIRLADFFQENEQ